MKTFLKLTPILILMVAAGCSKQTAITGMKCEYATQPVNVDELSPRFTWIYAGDYSQASFELCIATSSGLLASGKADVWSSGRIESGRSFAAFPGKTLESGKQYFWQVRTFDPDGRELLSPVASFRTAKMEEAEWTAHWITDGHDMNYGPSPMFRKSFTVGKKVKQAYACVTGVGFYELFVNGKRVGDEYLDPGFTHYDKRILYSTYDVTKMLDSGDNAIAAVLGNSFYNWQSQSTWNFDRARWRDRPRMICELKIDYADGSSETVVTDDSWKTATGPYLFNNMFSGDIYDARLLEDGWNDAGFDDSVWSQAVEAVSPTERLQSQMMPPMRITQEIAPVSGREFPGNIEVYDFGVNLTGFCRLKVKGEAGTKVRLTYAEMIKSDGRLEPGNINIYFHPADPANEVFQSDVYYLKGGGEEVFVPSFNYKGFRYVEVESDRPVEISKDGLTALFINTDVERVGTFSCSNDMLNKVYEATMRSYLGNLHSIPTDCPQREKNGWTADAYLAVDLGLLNYDGIKFYEKWLTDIIDNQRPDGSISGIIPTDTWGYADWIGPVWDAAMFIIPYALYNYYGDAKGIGMMYPVCERYLGYLRDREVDGTVTYGIGDWLPWKTKTPTEYTSTCFYYWDNVLMSRFAGILGRDGSQYDAKADSLRNYINERYFDAGKLTYSNGSQNALAVALMFDIVPEEYREEAAANLARMIRTNGYFIDSGVMGSKMIPRALARYGYFDTAFRMITQDKAPSWGYWIRQGHTTLPETWTMAENFADASLNHVFFGDVSAWMTNYLAGIRFDETVPGFKHFVIAPVYPEGLEWVKAEYNSVNGPIASSWKRKGNEVILEVTVPANTTATVVTDRENIVNGGKYSFTFVPATDYK